MQTDKDVKGSNCCKQREDEESGCTNLKCKSHGNLYNIVHEICCSPMCQIPKIKASSNFFKDLTSCLNMVDFPSS